MTELCKLAVGMFRAAPGFTYADAWARALLSGMTMPQIYDALAISPEFEGLNFGFSRTATNQQFRTRTSISFWPRPDNSTWRCSMARSLAARLTTRFGQQFVVGSSADELGAHMRATIAKLTKLVADANIRLEDTR